MASAEKLLAEAQYAFRNISPGSADERKHSARAKRYASKLLRKFPVSPEAEQARNILRHLGAGFAAPKRTVFSKRSMSPSPHVDHTLEMSHRHTTEQRKVIDEVLAPARKQRARSAKDDSWQNIWQIFLGLSYTKKKILAFLSVFLMVIVGFTPFLLVFFLYYAAQPVKIRAHLHDVVTYLA
jgi:hypothetical protein